MKKTFTFILILTVIFVSLLSVSCENDAAKICTVTFNSKGGTEVKSQEVLKNRTATEPIPPVMEHKDFIEWQLNGEAFDFDNTPVTEDITLDAIWGNAVYTLTFNSDGGTQFPVEYADYNSHFEKPEKNPEKEGYTFLDWYFGDEKYDFDTMVATTDITLKARWKEDIVYCTVNFFSTDNTTPWKSLTVISGERVTAPDTPSVEGSTFVEWDYENGYIYDFNTPVTGNLNLYAKWETSGSSTGLYNVRFQEEDGSLIYSTAVTGGGSVEASAPVSRDRHKVFVNWKAADGTTYKADETISVSSDITLTAVWRDYQKGDTGPAGGIIFYDAGKVMTSIYHDEFGNTVSYLWRYLEAAPEDIYNDDNDDYSFGYCRYSDNGQNYEIGTGISCGEGRMNTASLVNRMPNPAYSESGGSDKRTSAAVGCHAYLRENKGKEYSDWFLPSMMELNAMYEMKDTLKMEAKWYWSSSEFDWDFAYYMDFTNGQIYERTRDDWLAVRPIRAF